MKTKAIFVAMLLALAPLPSVAQDFDAGVAAYASGYYATALREWKPLAEQGYAIAQSNVGVMYAAGDGVPQDYTEAVRWYRAAAEQGYALAQNNLGLMYFKGHGVPQDYAKAHMWYNIGATNGDNIARARRESIVPLMTTADISEAQRRARVCMESDYQDCD